MIWKLLLSQRQASILAFPLLVRSCVAACKSLSRSVQLFPSLFNGKDRRTCPLTSALQGRLALPPAKAPSLLRGLSGLLADRIAVVLLTDLHSLIHSLFHSHFPRPSPALSLLLAPERHETRAGLWDRRNPILNTEPQTPSW